MTNQSIVKLFIFSILTFGIYSIFWLASRRGEMVRLGADIPTTWLIIVPIANYYYLWKFSQGVEMVTNKQLTGVISFLLAFLLGTIGYAIIQDAFNKTTSAAAGGMPQPMNMPQATMQQPMSAAQPQMPSNDQTPTPPVQPIGS